MLTANNLRGLFPAIVTPFDKNDNVDTGTLSRLVDRMFDGGARGIVPLGGTGEYTAQSPAERRKVIEISVAAAAGRGPVIAGVLSPGYAEALAAAKDFESAGADAIMLLTPFYALGAQAGILDYIRRVRGEIGIPIVLYEIPARTNISLEPDSIASLAEDRTAIGIKFSNYDVPRFARIAGLVGDDFALLGGEEPLTTAHHLMGARGGVLATANLFPEFWARLFELADEGKYAQAFEHQNSFQPVLDAVFAEANPGPLKTALELIGHPVGHARLPLQPPSTATVQQLRLALAPFHETRKRAHG